LRENMSLLADILTLLGAFFLGFIAGSLFPPLRRFLGGILHAPGQLTRGARNVGERLRQAFKVPAEEPLDRSGFSGALAGTVFDVMTVRVRRAEASFREGIAAFDKGEHDAARRRLTEAIFWDRKQELRPLHVLAHLRLGWLDEEKNALSQACEHYQKAVRLEPDNLNATVRLGMMHFRLGQTGPAIFQFQRALELDPADLDTHYCLYAIYRQAGMEREAVEQLRILKAGESGAVLSNLFSRHGEDNFRLSRYAEAIDDYELALQVDPDDIRSYVALGDLRHLQQEPHTALETWARGLWVGYSDALAERVLQVAGEHEDIWPVISLLRDCVARHPGDGRYPFLLARLLRTAGQEAESAALLKETVRVSPQLLEAQAELGDSYARAGLDAMARATYRAGLDAAHSQQCVYSCSACGYYTLEEQARCFQCNRWGTLEKITRREAEARAAAPRGLIERASALRQSLGTAWNRIAGFLPEG